VVRPREHVGAQRIDDPALLLRPEIDLVLDDRDPAFRAVFGVFPVLFARLRLDGRRVRVLDIDRDATERFGSGGPADYGTGFIDDSGRSVSRTNLAQATNDLLAQIVRSNPNLKVVPNSQRTDTISGAAALSLVLSGPSDVTRQEERITVFTRELTDDDVIYALFIAPGQDYGDLSRTFDHMIASLDVNERAAHR